MSDQNESDVVDFAAIARVSNRVVLAQIRFSSAQADSSVEPEEVVDSWGETSFLGFRTAFLLRPPDTLEVRVSFLAFHRKGEDLSLGPPPEFSVDDPAGVLIEADLVLTYGVIGAESLDPDDVAQFARVNSPMHAWPYWREFAQSSSSRLGIPTLVVGMYKVPSVYDPDVDAES